MGSAQPSAAPTAATPERANTAPAPPLDSVAYDGWNSFVSMREGLAFVLPPDWVVVDLAPDRIEGSLAKIRTLYPSLSATIATQARRHVGRDRIIAFYVGGLTAFKDAPYMTVALRDFGSSDLAEVGDAFVRSLETVEGILPPITQTPLELPTGPSRLIQSRLAVTAGASTVYWKDTMFVFTQTAHRGATVSFDYDELSTAVFSDTLTKIIAGFRFTPPAP